MLITKTSPAPWAALRRICGTVVLLTTIPLGAAGPALAQASGGAPFLVRDIVTEPIVGGILPVGGGYLSSLEAGGAFYFAARDRQHGNELWRTDGTAEGTWLVDDLCPGPCGSDPQVLATVGGRVLLTADDRVHGVELWATDGRPGAAELILESEPGPGPPFWSSDVSFALSGGRLYFTLDRALWVTDGTRSGTMRIREIPGARFLGRLFAVGGELVFTVRTAGDGQIWRSDGTAAGTGPVLSACPGARSCLLDGLAVLGDRFVYSTGTSLRALDLGTEEIAELAPIGGGSCSDSQCAALHDGRLYLLDGHRVAETDGTPSGTRTFAELDPQRRAPRFLSALPHALLVADEELLTSLSWKGAQPTTLFEGDLFQVGVESPLTRVGDRVFFRTAECVGDSCDRQRITALWTSDGTRSGTGEVVALCGSTVACSEDALVTQWLGAGGGGGLYYFLLDGIDTGPELWRSDGTAAGTGLLADLWTDPGSASRAITSPLEATVAPTAPGPVATADRLVFPVRVATVGDRPWTDRNQVWRTDGTSAGTAPVGPLSGPVRGLVALGDAALFGQDDELWRVGGMDGMLERVSSATTLGNVSTVHGGRLYFGRGACDDELWVTDGSSEGTRLLGEFFGTECDVAPWAVGVAGPFVPLGETLLFSANDAFGPISGSALWRLGQDDEPRVVAAVSLVVHDSAPLAKAMAAAAGRVLLAAIGRDEMSELGVEPWVSDGTAEGTRLLVDLAPGPESSFPHDLVRFRGGVAFFASSSESPESPGGESLWLSDGTVSGTRRISDLVIEGAPSWASWATVAGDRLFFVASGAATGPELWVSDGTAAGTHIVADIRPGPRGSYPQGLTAVEIPGDPPHASTDSPRVVFAADDGESGLEPWVSDGTVAGTRRVADLAPGRAASSPSAFTAAGDLLYFWADDGDHGRELWAVERSALGSATPGEADPSPPPGAWLTSPELPGLPDQGADHAGGWRSGSRPPSRRLHRGEPLRRGGARRPPGGLPQGDRPPPQRPPLGPDQPLHAVGARALGRADRDRRAPLLPPGSGRPGRPGRVRPPGSAGVHSVGVTPETPTLPACWKKTLLSAGSRRSVRRSHSRPGRKVPSGVPEMQCAAVRKVWQPIRVPVQRKDLVRRSPTEGER